MRSLVGPFMVLAVAAACAEPDALFLALPEIDSSKERVILAIECAGSISVQVLTPEALSATPTRVDCDSAVVSILEYDRSLDELGLAEGPVTEAPESGCGVLPLPPSDRVLVGRIDQRGVEVFAPLAEGEPLPGRLAEFRYQRACPCESFELVSRLAVPRAYFYFVYPEPSGTFLIFAKGLDPFDRIDIYRTDLTEVRHVYGSTVAVYPFDPDDEVDEGIAEVQPGPDGRYYLAGDYGQIFVYTPDAELRLLTEVPGAREIERMAVSPVTERFEIFVLTTNHEVWRYRPGEDWYQYAFEARVQSGSSQVHSIVWTGTGRAFVAPGRTEDILYLDGDRHTLVPWPINGSVHAVANLPDLGLVAGTRRNQLFMLDAENPDQPTELFGPNGQPMEPTQSWFRSIAPLSGGFLATFSGPDGFLRYHEDWGYCPLSIHLGEDVGLRSTAIQGDMILAGGELSASLPSEVMLSVFRMTPAAASARPD